MADQQIKTMALHLVSSSVPTISSTWVRKAETREAFGAFDENTVWIEPVLACTVKFMMRTKNGGLRQPVFKTLRDDKAPQECKAYTA